MLASQLAAYLSEHDPDFAQVAHAFAAMTSSEADQLAVEIEKLEREASAASENMTAEDKVSLEHQIASAKARQLRWRAMALGCYGCGQLRSEDVRHMLVLMVGG